MADANRSEHFIRATMRHFAELRSSGPEKAASKKKFPKDWFDLPDPLLADMGALYFLSSLTTYHRKRTLADISGYFEPPIRLNQYRIFRSDNFARAGITWAGLSHDAEKRFAVDHTHLHPEDWNSGTSVWLVDFLSPFGHVDQIVPLLTQNKQLRRVRTMWHNKEGTRYRVVEWSRPPGDTEISVASYGQKQFARLLEQEA